MSDIKRFSDMAASLGTNNGDHVNHPNHYEQYSMETIEAIKGQSTHDEYRGFLKGNIMKYLARYRSKNGIEDLNKAEWYLQRLIAFENERLFAIDNGV